ncbi:MAG: thermonuclease family protein, partial [Alphaproteobacteria bacterium]
MLKPILVTLFSAIFAWFSCFFYLIAISKSSFSYDSIYRVKSHLVFDKEFSGKAKVLDGDSIKVGNNEVRLFGLDAPEYKQTCLDQNNQEYNCGINSRDFLQKLIAGKKVRCTYASKDKYDRFLGICYLEKLSINAEIVKNGMAVIYNFTESSDEMNALEIQAKASKIGIWQGSFEL